MSHLDPSLLAAYNSLTDPHLQNYFSNERIRSHLKQAGLISGQGEIISDGEYRSRLARREHAKHVRNMLAENIVNRAIDMERVRQAEMKRQYEMITKAALVNNMKEARKRGGNLSGILMNTNDIGLLSIDLPCSQPRPKSANVQNEMYNEQVRVPQLPSAQFTDDFYKSDSSNTLNRRQRRSGHRRRSSQRRKSSSINHSSSLQRHHSSSKYLDLLTAPSCQIAMVYYGPHTKVDYDHLVFEQIDEIIVMQQHCGGENLIVYKNYLKPGDEFTFESRRRSDYPFGLSLYVKGLIDSRISTCCEYKHRHGVKLGGDRGHFAIKSVQGSKPCIRCQYEKEARLKRYAQSPKEREDESKMPITISLPISDEPKTKDNTVTIPVHRTSTCNEDANYPFDFDDLDTQKKVSKREHSASSSRRSSHMSEQNLDSYPATPKVLSRTPPPVRKKSSIKSDSDFDITPKVRSRTKTWQIVFHEHNIDKDVSEQELNRLLHGISLKVSFIANDQNKETEIHEFSMKELMKNCKSAGGSTFPIKRKNVRKPERIRLEILSNDESDTEDEAEQENFKWHLGRIEIIDPETQSHLIFPCDEWIRPSQKKTLKLSQDLPGTEQQRKSSRSGSSSSSQDNSYQKSPTTKHKGEISYRSRTSSTVSKQSKPILKPAHENIANNQSTENEETTSRDDLTNRECKIRYHVIIYPANDDEGIFNPDEKSRIFLCLNNHVKTSNLTNGADQSCPKFEAGVEKAFNVDLLQNMNEKPKKLKIGYINSNPDAQKWKLKKIVLINEKTKEKTIFLCHQGLIRNESNFCAEQTFQSRLEDSSDESTTRSEKIGYSKSNGQQEVKASEKKQLENDDDNDVTITADDDKIPHADTKKQKSPSLDKTSDHDDHDNKTKNKNKERLSSFESMNDNDAHYATIFRQLDPKNELKLGSSPSSPSTSRSGGNIIKTETTNHVVDPLDGLDGLTDPTPRSIDQHNHTSIPSRTTENSQNRFGNSRRTDNADDEED